MDIVVDAYPVFHDNVVMRRPIVCDSAKEMRLSAPRKAPIRNNLRFFGKG